MRAVSGGIRQVPASEVGRTGPASIEGAEEDSGRKAGAHPRTVLAGWSPHEFRDFPRPEKPLRSEAQLAGCLIRQFLRRFHSHLQDQECKPDTSVLRGAPEDPWQGWSSPHLICLPREHWLHMAGPSL